MKKRESMNKLIKRQRFSIRKFTFGVASVMVGMGLYATVSMDVRAEEIQIEETNDEDTVESDEEMDVTDSTVESSTEEESISLMGVTSNDVASVNGVSYETLEDAITNAQSGDTISLLKDVETGSNFNSGADQPISVVDKVLTIIGNGYSITRTSDYIGTLFTIGENASLTFQDVILDGGASKWSWYAEDPKTTSGYANDKLIVTVPDDDDPVWSTEAAIVNNGTLIFDGATFENFITKGVSPIVSSGANSVVSIENGSIIQHNMRQTNYGGVFNITNGTLRITDSICRNNGSGGKVNGTTAWGAGGVATFSNGKLYVNNSKLSSNYSGNSGVFHGSFSSYELYNSKFVGNTIGNDGGVTQFNNNHHELNAIVQNCIFDGNIGLAQGNQSMGGVFYFSGGSENVTMTIRNCTFRNNESSAGGAISDVGVASKVYIYDSDFYDNYATSGGVLYAQSLITEIYNSNLYNNTSGRSGGVFVLIDTSQLSVYGSNIYNNKANRDGGVVSAYYNAQVTLQDTTVTGNTAARYGGAIYLTSSTSATSNFYLATFTMKEGTKLYGNSAQEGGDDISAVYNENYTHVINLLDASTMNVYTKDGVLITGWYYDTPDEYSELLYEPEEDYLYRFKRNKSGELDSLALSLSSDGSRRLFLKAETEGYYVIYDKNADDASGTMDTQKYYESDGSKVLGNSFVRKGYTFVGWNTNADGSGKVVDAGSLCDALLDQNVTHLYAQWKINEHTITIYYVDEQGNLLAQTIHDTYAYGSDFSYESPQISGYSIRDILQNLISGTMDDEDLVFTVVYTKDEENETSQLTKPSQVQEMKVADGVQTSVAANTMMYSSTFLLSSVGAIILKRRKK